MLHFAYASANVLDNEVAATVDPIASWTLCSMRNVKNKGNKMRTCVMGRRIYRNVFLPNIRWVQEKILPLETVSSWQHIPQYKNSFRDQSLYRENFFSRSKKVNSQCRRQKLAKSAAEFWPGNLYIWGIIFHRRFLPVSHFWLTDGPDNAPAASLIGFSLPFPHPPRLSQYIIQITEQSDARIAAPPI